MSDRTTLDLCDRVVCSRSLVRQIVAEHPEIPADAAVDIDLGDGENAAVINPSAIEEFWKHWPMACFIASMDDSQQAIDLVAKRLKR